MKKGASQAHLALLFMLLTVMYLVGGLESFRLGSVVALSIFFLFAFFSLIAAVGCHLQRRISFVFGFALSFLGIVSIFLALATLYLEARIPFYFVVLMILTVINTLLFAYLSPRAQKRRR